MRQKPDNNFWPSYSDLMTSLFFIMLVLFVLSFGLFHKKTSELRTNNIKLHQATDSLKTTYNKLLKICEIDTALQMLDPNYFVYNSYCKRHELKIDIMFEPDDWDLTLPKYRKYHQNLITVGKYLQNKLSSIDTSLHVKFQLLIEGRAARHDNERENRIFGTTVKYLSYDRAKSLFDLWTKAGISFNPSVIEVIIAGSGFEGQCRYTGKDEYKNKRFVIQIIPKVGDLKR
jgi:hypothetical protein